MPTPTCPKCNSEKVKPVTIWHVTSTSHYVTEPPLPMFACQELSCLHKWARPQDAEVTRLQTKWKNQGDPSCTHSTQRLVDVSFDDTNPVMALYYCEECGKEFVRPYIPF